MKPYRAEQIIRWREIQYSRLRGGNKRKLYKLLWQNRGKYLYGKDDD